MGIGVMTPFVQLIWRVLISCFKEHRGLLKIEHTPRLCDYYIALVDKRCCGFQIHKPNFAQRFLNAGTSCAANLVGLPNFGDTPRLANQSFNVTNNVNACFRERAKTNVLNFKEVKNAIEEKLTRACQSDCPKMRLLTASSALFCSRSKACA